MAIDALLLRKYTYIHFRLFEIIQFWSAISEQLLKVNSRDIKPNHDLVMFG